MKMFKPVTVKMDDATQADLERILEAEKQQHPRHSITRGSLIRSLIHDRARRVSRKTNRDTSA